MTQDTPQAESKSPLVGLCTIVASLIVVEVCLTKFVSYKVHHHFVYAIISCVVLASGFAGVSLHWIRKRVPDLDLWRVCSWSCALYSLTLIGATLLFCWMPLDPYNFGQIHFWQVLLPISVYFLLLSVPFYFAGLAVSATLVRSRRAPAEIYFFDLLAAAVGAAICPATLEHLGGYGTIQFAAALGMVACIAYGFHVSRWRYLPILGLFLLLTVATSAYPKWALEHWGFDIRTAKNLNFQKLVIDELKGIDRTWWNAIARIDITHTGVTRHFESTQLDNQPEVECRFILVDGGAPTRQMAARGDLFKNPLLPNYLWASPYVLRPKAERSMIIGPGGGLDILIAKIFGVRNVDAVELNPSTYKHVLLGQDDPEAAIYQPWLQSTNETKVNIHCSEARHFASTQPEQSFDVIQATAVDTLTAITSGALSMVENYLYTSDAIADYMRILKPTGVLSLTHWRSDPPGPSAREFMTYLDYLDKQGIKEPWKHVVVVANDWWADEMIKPQPFTQAEVKQIRDWANAHGHIMLFDPYQKVKLDKRYLPSEIIYQDAGFATREQRLQLLNKITADLRPVTDDKPFFYKFEKEENFYFSSNYSSTPIAFLLITLVLSLLLFTLPLVSISKEISRKMLAMSACFAAAGFAFFLYETAIIQTFTVFVGGPLYSLGVVLVAVLGGYAGGSFIARRLTISKRTFAILAVILGLEFVILYFGLHHVIHALMPAPIAVRVCISAAITALCSVVVGIPVSLAMNGVKSWGDDLLAWMWGVSCASNALGAMSFGLIAQSTGVSATLLIVAALYVVANIGLGLLFAERRA